MSIYYEPVEESLTDQTHHLEAALEAVAATAKKLKQERDEARDDLEFRRELYALQTERLQRIERERDEARAVIRMLWQRAETHLDLSDEEIDRVNRSWGESTK